jgi:hypothetical protein
VFWALVWDPHKPKKKKNRKEKEMKKEMEILGVEKNSEK